MRRKKSGRGRGNGLDSHIESLLCVRGLPQKLRRPSPRSHTGTVSTEVAGLIVHVSSLFSRSLDSRTSRTVDIDLGPTSGSEVEWVCLGDRKWCRRGGPDLRDKGISRDSSR